VDRMCRFSYVQTSGTPVLLFRPECADSTFPTLTSDLARYRQAQRTLVRSEGRRADHPGAHQLDRRQSDRSPALAGLQ